MQTKKQAAIIAKITTKNQVTIPKPIRQRLNIHSHDELAFEVQDNGDILVRKNEEKEDIWQLVAEQQKKYGHYEATEFNWGEDVGKEVISE
ncbi:AbrB/MazE/SpoVT family DNA-binding domain-containing protein [Enterococcus sp. UD-01]|jgi:antitoxin PrlF|uniref:AbrB/MazE/SpoVT family DNA-binding domain-containing protein n=1 Tax=Enterococcus sp. UD-01 TaxID=3373911 RepID=UPI003834B5AF